MLTKNKYLIVIFLILLDQISKLIFQVNQNRCFLIFCIELVKNKGIIFGINLNYWIILFLSLGLLFLMLYYFVNLTNKYLNWSLIFLISGLLSNLIDRIIHKAVIDWIKLKYFNIAFNFADCFEWIGIILFLIFLIKTKKNF